jgi:amino acid transporter
MFARGAEMYENLYSRNRQTTNRTLFLYSAPIFAFWICLLLTILLARLDAPAFATIFSITAFLLFLGSPLCVALGWRVFVRHKERFRSQDLGLGRKFLIVASVLASPIVIFTIVYFVYAAIYFLGQGSLFH